MFSALHNTADDGGASGCRQAREFIEWVFGGHVPGQDQASQNTSFACQAFRAIMCMQRVVYSWEKGWFRFCQQVYRHPQLIIATTEALVG